MKDHSEMTLLGLPIGRMDPVEEIGNLMMELIDDTEHSTTDIVTGNITYGELIGILRAAKQELNNSR